MAATVFEVQKMNLTLHFNRNLCNLLIGKVGKRWCSKYFLTTPIFYVNADPHIGHLYTALLGDAANRFQKLKNPSITTKFMVGTDEHGLKVMQSAGAKNAQVKYFCDEISNKYKKMFDHFDIEYDDFVRTTEDRHKKAAVALWNKIYSKNLIYSDNYSGWYCVADEMFVSEHLLDPKIGSGGERYTLEGNKRVHLLEEVNYKFKLKSFKDDLLNWVKGDVVKPKFFSQELTRWLEEEAVLNDISVSRPAERVSWGIPVPGDPAQTIYVWLDALSSYLCASGYPETHFKWPPDVQIVGKDILKFHGVFWPAFLMAADLEPPRHILCHSHWLRNDEKMSKSKNNVVDPFQSSAEFTSDGLRYYLLRTGTPQHDGNFSDSKIPVCLNAELGDSMGNLLSRCTGKNINKHQVFPGLFDDYQKYKDEACDDLMSTLEELPEKVTGHFEEFNFYKGIDDIMAGLHTVNKFFQDRKPWSSDLCEENKKLTLHLAMEACRCIGILLQPIIPKTSGLLLDKLSIPTSRRSLSDIRPYSWEKFESSKSEDVKLETESRKLFVKLKTHSPPVSKKADVRN